MFVTDEIKPPDHVEKPKKERKKRKPMTEEQKQVLRERLAKAREAKKLKKEGKVVAPKAPKKEKVLMKVEEKTPIPKAEMVKPVKVKDELAEMKEQLRLLQTRNKQQEKELTKAALEKEKLKKMGLDYIAKAKSAQKKNMPTIEEQVDESEPSKTVVNTEQPIAEKPKARYSTYKKSIWSQFE